MKWCAVVILLCCLLTPAVAQSKRGPSTPEERTAIVELAKKLEANPLDASLRPGRERLLRTLIEVPDITVTLCASALPTLKEKKYKYAGELTSVFLFSSAAYVIEHPQANDKGKVALAGLDGSLRAYQAILASDPKGKSKEVDKVLAQAQDPAFREKIAAQCKQ